MAGSVVTAVLLALLAFAPLVLLLARACGMGAGWDDEWVDLDGEPCEHPRCPCRWVEVS